MPIPKSPQATARRTLRHDAYLALKARILDGTLEPGERLDDQEMQDWLGISRTPIREALVILDAEGLVDTKAQHHTRVASPDPDLARDEVMSLGALMASCVRQMQSVMDDAVVQALREPVTLLAEAAKLRDPLQTADALAGFYKAILAHCPNVSLVEIVTKAATLLTFQLRATIDDVAFEWDALVFSADALHDSTTRRDVYATAQIIETMHFIPLPE